MDASSCTRPPRNTTATPDANNMVFRRKKNWRDKSNPWRCASAAHLTPVHEKGFAYLRECQRDFERRPLPETLASRANRATVRLDDAPADRQPQAKSSECRIAAGDLLERLEELLD